MDIVPGSGIRRDRLKKLRRTPNIMSGYPWIIEIDNPSDPRLGVQVRNIQLGNDGDVCNSFVTHELLSTGKPVFCLDIGVDEGWWSFFVADINSQAVVYGFEPNPHSYSLLQSQMDTRVLFFNVAISNAIGPLNMTFAKGESHSRSEGEHTQVVPTMTLEPFIQGKHVDCIKIDTEGHDLIILRTLYPYLDRISSIIFEFTVYWYESVEESRKVLYHLLTIYPYMYTLSRRGPPVVVGLETTKDIDMFVEFCNNNQFQSDILVSREPIKSIPVRKLRV